MTVLISSEIYKLFRSKAAAIILLCIAAMTIFWVISNYTDGYVFFGYEGVTQAASMSSILHLWFPAFVGYFVATEFQNGTIRNVICMGKSRTNIYLSKLTSVGIFTAATLIVVSVVATAGYSIAYGFGDKTLIECLRFFIWNYSNQFLYHLALTSLFTLLAFAFKSPIMTALLGIGYVLVNFFFIPFLRNFGDGQLKFITEYFPEHYINGFRYFNSDPAFITKGIIVCLAWIVILFLTGCVVFKKSDIK